jgi:hypothetical protein
LVSTLTPRVAVDRVAGSIHTAKPPAQSPTHGGRIVLRGPAAAAARIHSFCAVPREERQKHYDAVYQYQYIWDTITKKMQQGAYKSSSNDDEEGEEAIIYPKNKKCSRLEEPTLALLHAMVPTKIF